MWQASKKLISSHTTQKLQLVHTDVRGAQKTTSLNGKRYYIIFIDDYTRFCWIYFFKSKYEVSQIFWKYKALVENQNNCRLQTISSDNGIEYKIMILTSFVKNMGLSTNKMV